MSATAASIFGTPERNSDQSFTIPLRQPIPLHIRVLLNAEGISPTLEYQSKFQEVQTYILNELVKNKQLYKSPPTYESLQCMTTAWGFLRVGGAVQLSKSMVCNLSIPVSQYPCIVDFVLQGLTISRTLIQPVFTITYIEPAEKGGNIIDFDWGVQDAPTDATAELQEVSDVSFMASAGGDMKIKDPATLLREKLAAKERVRAAYRAAESARETADQLASQFYAAYDLSDTESAFSEWADLSDDDSEDDGASR
jgi:hypothetical protein